jgi:hypothetical protein
MNAILALTMECNPRVESGPQEKLGSVLSCPPYLWDSGGTVVGQWLDSGGTVVERDPLLIVFAFLFRWLDSAGNYLHVFKSRWVSD